MQKAEFGMLRINTEQSGGHYRLELHGRIVGAWVGVLERHWRDLLGVRSSAMVTVDVSNVAFIDRQGERLLRRMVRHGVGLSGSGCMSRYVIETISGGV